MRGRGGPSSSSEAGFTTAMKLADAPQIQRLPKVERDELSSALLSPASREKRKRETENKSKSKEMTEEEMMDLALRLSEQEASVNALRVQQEEEAMMKAIQESMGSQTQAGSPSQSRRPLAGSEASLSIFSRRKLLYANGTTPSAIVRGAAEDVCTPETGLNRGAKATGEESNNRLKKRKRKEGSPLLEVAQNISSQAPACRSEGLPLPPDSPQSSDSTQVDACPLLKSPVFPSTDCKATVHVPRLGQELLEACRTSGFVVCSQDSLTSTRKSQTTPAKSPIFPKSPKRSHNLPLSKSLVFIEADRGDDTDTDRSPEYFKSPVFGRNARHEMSSGSSEPQDGDCNLGFIFCSDESLSSSVRSTSSRTKSPVFPESPGLPKNFPTPEKSPTCKSPVFSETIGRCASPVFGRIGKRRGIHRDAELRGSDGDGNLTTTGSPSQGPRQDDKTDNNNNGHKSSKSDDADEELDPVSKDSSAKAELTSDVTLLWSDNDDNATVRRRPPRCGGPPVGSPSPVFPQEAAVHRGDGEDASLSRAAASPGTNCRPSTSSTSTSGQLPSTAERGPRPIGSQGSVSRAAAPPRGRAGGPTVHYYWGVPFCPRGVDPDEYTQVILGHMEVYEKSLKQAQRGLLRKAEWGEAVLPQPEKSPSPESPAESPPQLVLRRRGIKLRNKNVSEATDTLSVEAEEDEEDQKDGEEERKGKGEEEKKEGEEEGQADTDDCEVCPETQLSDDDRTQDLLMAPDAGEELASKKSPEPPEVEMILQVDSPAGAEEEEEEQEEEMEVEAAVDRKTEMSVPVGRQHAREERIEEDEADPDVEEIKDPGLQRLTSPDRQPAAPLHRPESKVDCPMCQGSYPASEIERHAAYCDGEVAVVEERRPEKVCFQVSLKPRRKRTRRAEATAEEAYEPPNTGKDVIDLRDDDDDDDEEEAAAGGGVSSLRNNSSPIRAFTPISEATGCLIDFKKQQRAKTLRQRRR
ncbi:BRCA1-A complex subunit RAP80 [Liparis tanakae]|uniref:BRCA1-A complex subunit RAP80 n=1 Tax=Liparis tanakae TaxID=230148 RepID=A0A4Z2GS35_9TELE|nr:BRCA1-A complex subunit RAP80 [Liparis tanakae]